MGLSLIALPSTKAFLAPLCMICALMLPLDHFGLTLLAVDHGAGSFSKYNRNLLVNAAVLPMFLGLLWMTGIRSIGTVVAATLAIPALPWHTLRHRGIPNHRKKGRSADSQPAHRRHSVRGGPNIERPLRPTRRGADPVVGQSDRAGILQAAISTAAMLVVAPTRSRLFLPLKRGESHPPSLGRTVAAGVGVLAIQLVALAGFLTFLEPLIVLVFGRGFAGPCPTRGFCCRPMRSADCLASPEATSAASASRSWRSGLASSEQRSWWRGPRAAGSMAQSIVPMAAVCGHTTCAVILCWAVLADTHRRRVLAREQGEAVLA